MMALAGVELETLVSKPPYQNATLQLLLIKRKKHLFLRALWKYCNCKTLLRHVKFFVA